MTETHPELAAEQQHLELAYARLESARDEAVSLQSMVEVGRGGTNQARWEREIINENIANRLKQLDLGERSLCFGRIDQGEESGGGTYHIGRIAVSGKNHEPLIVDWRAPVAEAFYRATGGDPQGLVRRRHFVSRGRSLLDLEDEFFGEAALGGRVVVNGRELQGRGALVAALEENRSGRLGDIIGTIQGEQDEIIRDALPGVLVVQGGPGTGKTVVALHRAAYLLYAHRFPLEGQGVLVIGPNRLFLGYIEQVLPSLGEAGVELAVLGQLVPQVRVQGRDEDAAARIKGDLRMVHVVRRAVRDRQRALTSDLVVGVGARRVRMTVAQSVEIVSEARRRFRWHNSARKYVVAEVHKALAASHPDGMSPEKLAEQVDGSDEVRAAFTWMWPILTPAMLLHDLYGSRALLRSAGGRHLNLAECTALFRPWRSDMDASRVVWTADDVAVLDEAHEVLGPRPKRKNYDDIRTYGHIVVDEAQDLSPMQLRMLTRRSLNGSMTIVGDIAQSTGAWAHDGWDEVLEHLPDKKPPRTRELTVGYRIPSPSMALAARVLREAAPDLKPPVAVRDIGDEPRFVAVDPKPAATAEMGMVDAVAEAVANEAGKQIREEAIGSLAIIVPQSLYEPVLEAFHTAGINVGRAPQDGLKWPITVVPVRAVKGLEVDASVVVEPAAILNDESQGVRSLYVAVTRATKRVTIVHAQPLPPFMNKGHQTDDGTRS